MIRLGLAKRLPNVPLLVNGDAESLPFQDSSFDAVVSCYVAKYVDLGRFVSELARVTRPRGRVLVYDFVRPSGIFAPVLEFYLRCVVRTAGLLLSLAKSPSAFTFTNLPRIVDGATWDRAVVALMESYGFETDAFERLTGGTVSAYSGIKRAH
jgi:ubiquinone/menaquinone biosynthesis C-methylase UbiE